MKSTRVQNTSSEAEKHHLIGNSLALDFANTLYGHGDTPIHEYLYGYRDLVIWGLKAGILDSPLAQDLLARADKQPAVARRVFRRAIHLREVIFSIFDTIAHDQSPSPDAVVLLNDARRHAYSHSSMTQKGKEFVLSWDEPTDLERMLWPIALDAGELLTSSNLSKVRQCSGETCDWLFVDTSRNHMRRWCQMSVCGNRSKVRRYFRRQQISSSQP